MENRIFAFVSCDKLLNFFSLICTKNLFDIRQRSVIIKFKNNFLLFFVQLSEFGFCEIPRNIKKYDSLSEYIVTVVIFSRKFSNLNAYLTKARIII